MNASAEFVFLRGGLTIPREALTVVLDLERRGITIRRDGDAIVVNPRAQVTDEDRAKIRRWRTHISALLDYSLEGQTIQ